MRQIVKPGIIERTYKPVEVAAELGVTRRTVYTWLRSGILPATKIGPKLWFVKESDLRSFLEGQGSGPSPSPAAPPGEQPSLPPEYLPTGSGALKPLAIRGKKKRRG